MEFGAIRKEVEGAVSHGAYTLDMTQLMPAAAAKLRGLLGLAELRLAGLKVLENTESTIVLCGEHQLRGSAKLYASLTLWPKAGGVGYALAVAPSGDWRDVLPDAIESILRIASLKVEDLYVTACSEALAQLNARLSDVEEVELPAVEGVGCVLRIDNPVFAALGLASKHLQVDPLAASLNFTFPPKTGVRLFGGLFTFVLHSASFAGTAVTLNATATFDFLGVQFEKLAALNFASPLSVSLEVGVSESILIPLAALAARGLALRDAKINVSGSPTSYTIGVRGAFEIKGSRNGGTYKLAFSPASTSVPQLVELQAENLTLSDACTVALGLAVKMPPELDGVVTLREPYLYYASAPGLATAAGRSLGVGVALRSDVVFFGYAAKLAVEALEGEPPSAVVILPTISFGDVLKISGDRRGMVFELNTRYPRATAIVAIECLGQKVAHINAWAEVGGIGTQITVQRTVLGDLHFDITVASARAVMAARYYVYKDIDVGVLKATAVIQGALTINADVRQVSATVDGTLEVACLRIQLPPITINPKQLDHALEELWRTARRELEKCAKDAEAWARALAEGLAKGLVEFTERTAQEIRQFMNDVLKLSYDAAGKLLVDAGVRVEHALGILSNHLRGVLDGPSFSDAMKVLQKAGVAPPAIVAAMKKMLDAFPRELELQAADFADVLRDFGSSPEVIVDAIKSYLKDPEKIIAVAIGIVELPPVEVLRLLRLPLEVEKTAKWLTMYLPVPLARAPEIERILSAVFPAREATRAVNDVFKVGEVGVRNLRDEGKRFFKKLGRIRL